MVGVGPARGFPARDGGALTPAPSAGVLFSPGTTHTQSVGDLPVAQDGPPPGGFPSVRYGRRIPNTGPSGAVVFGLVCLGMGYGFYKTAQYNRYQNRLTEEKINTRMALTPFLQAEADRVFVQRQAKFHAWARAVRRRSRTAPRRS